MSDGMRMPLARAKQEANRLVDYLADICQRIEIGGSVRRDKATVGDVEIVALPRQARELLARLDRLVIDRLIHKAVYSDGRTRWGEKYRGFYFGRIRYEIFLAEADNWGYMLWLRTGPADANKFVMDQVIFQHAPYRASGGYWWSSDGEQISVPDEIEMFRLLGMPYLAPHERELERYRWLMRPAQWAVTWTVAAAPEEAPTQGSLF